MHRRHILRSALAAAAISAWAGVAAASPPIFDLGNPDAPRLKPGPPVEYGTTQESFYTIPQSEFDPATSDYTYSDVGVGGSSAIRFATSPGLAGFIASPHLPDGAVLTSITYQWCDSNTMDMHVLGGLVECDGMTGFCALAGNPQATTSDIVTPCKEYTDDLSALNLVVNNRTRRLAVVATTYAGDSTNGIVGAVVGYRLQVSPAPVTATFGDVPTSHPFFQYIEALAKSGITGGCGGGNYCPDSPVTRGQMAVFVSKALGLHWPLMVP